MDFEIFPQNVALFLLDFALFIEDFGNNAYNYQLHNVGPMDSHMFQDTRNLVTSTGVA